MEKTAKITALCNQKGGRLDIDVYAKSFEEAKEKAMGEFASADLKDMEIIGAKPVNAEAADGTFEDY